MTIDSDPIEILSEESHFMTINKPAGIQSQAVEGVPCVQRILAAQIAKRDQHSGNPFIGLPHRLDRVTSGTMVIAKNQRALKQFNAQFQSRKIQKFYLAVLESEHAPKTEKAVWSDHIRKIPDVAKAEIVETAHGKADGTAKLAELAILPLAHSEQRELVLIQLLTGRMHQIRIQAAARTKPVLGDVLYNAKQQFGTQEPNFREPPIALHSLRIEFRHPKTGLETASTAPPPTRWQSLPSELEDRIHEVVKQSQKDTSNSWVGKFTENSPDN